MSHRSGGAFRTASSRDLGVLALGVVLVITGVALSTCGSAEAFWTIDVDPTTSVATTESGGER